MHTDTVADLNPGADARRGFVELWGGPLVLNAWLAAACGVLTLLVLALVAALVHTASQAASLKPIVVRIDQVGRAEAVSYDAATWKPQTPELRYFLTRFVTLHYARMRATVARDYPASLLFLGGQLGNTLLASAGITGPVETFVQNPAADERDVEVKNVTFSDLSTPPYRASVDFVTLEYGPSSRTPRATTTYTAQVAFTLRESVPNALVPVNPLGLQITQLRLDQAFTN